MVLVLSTPSEHRVIGIDFDPRQENNPFNGHGAEMIIGDSPDIATFETLKHKLNGEMIDVLFIDGDHSYDGVKRDYEMYGPLARVVAFHDICQHLNPEIEVDRFWRELGGIEIIREPDWWGGIGVHWQ